MNATEAATLATAAFAAVAAGASWASVLQTRKERRAAETPQMSIDVMVVNGRSVRVQLTNHGPAARGVEFAVEMNGQMAYGHPPPTPVFQPGETRLIETAIQPVQRDQESHAFVSCYDITGRYLHVSWPDGRQRMYSPVDRPDQRVRRDELMREVDPSFSLDGVAFVRYWLVDTRDA